MQSSSSIPDEALFPILGPAVLEERNNILVAAPSIAEINEAVFSLKRSSSLGPDGCSSVFFTQYWDIVGPDVIKAVTHFFQNM